MGRNDPWLRDLLGIEAAPDLWFEIQPIAAAVFGVPLGLVVMVVASLLTPAPGPQSDRFVDSIRDPRPPAA